MHRGWVCQRPNYPKIRSSGCERANRFNNLRGLGLSPRRRARQKFSVPGIALAEHRFTNIDDVVKEVIDARIYGGMHYRTSGVHGSVIARKVATYVARHYFLPAR